MKGTSHKILSLVLALVLVVSMLATIVAPAVAVTTVVNANSPTTAGAAAQYTVTFLHTAAAPAGTVISLTFPSTIVLPTTISYQNVRVGIAAGAAAATAAEVALLAADPAPVVSAGS